MKKILLFGAGKSATVLISYLISEAEQQAWEFVIADANKDLVLAKTNNSPFAKAVQLDIHDEAHRSALIRNSDIVISMMPPDLHFLIAKDCVEYGKHLLTASYLDDKIKSLQNEIENKKLLFLCEMGLDPGIDHMSAMKIIDRIKAKGGSIRSFKSHCGGLVAPESDDNPWHYKISWNPRNIVMAGKAGAMYKMNGHIVKEKYEELFEAGRTVNTDEEIRSLSYYPNRDSLPYIDVYGLQEAETFMRTTLRYPDFMYGWNNIVELKLTDEKPAYDTDGLSLAGFFKQHLDKMHFSKLLNTEKISKLISIQLRFIGMDDDTTFINKGYCSAADVLQFALETKLALSPADKDMIVMLHEFEYILNDNISTITSSLVVKGEDGVHTAMAKTVGLPMGIAAKLILNGTIQLTGLHIPTRKTIYEPVLTALEEQGIRFVENP